MTTPADVTWGGLTSGLAGVGRTMSRSWISGLLRDILIVERPTVNEDRYGGTTFGEPYIQTPVKGYLQDRRGSEETADTQHETEMGVAFLDANIDIDPTCRIRVGDDVWDVVAVVNRAFMGRGHIEVKVSREIGVRR
jgi:hypothetical protein